MSGELSGERILEPLPVPARLCEVGTRADLWHGADAGQRESDGLRGFAQEGEARGAVTGRR
jgi:hypothetical protein